MTKLNLLESYQLLNTELSVLIAQLEISQPLQCYDSADDEDVDPPIIIKMTNSFNLTHKPLQNSVPLTGASRISPWTSLDI